MYHIIVNSTRLKGKNADSIDIVKSVFDRAGKQYEFHYTEHAGHAKEIAAKRRDLSPWAATGRCTRF